MTQALETPITSYLPTAAAVGPFATVWTYADPAEVQVVVVDVDGVEDVLTVTTDYTLAATGGDSLANGGGVTLQAGAVPDGAWDGQRLVLRRVTAASQPSSFVDVAGFRPQDVAASLDRLTRSAQEQKVESARAVRAPLGEAGHSLPSRAALADKFLVGDGDGNLVALGDEAAAELLAADVVAGIVATGAAEVALVAAQGVTERTDVVATGDAQSARLDAETAANLALIAAANGPRYPDVATGVAAVAADAYFLVVGSSADLFAELYRKTAGIGVKQVGGELSSHAYIKAVALAARAPKNLPTTGLLAEWLFDEVDGATVDNVINPGTYDIDLEAPASPDPSWKRTASGFEGKNLVVQTPVVTGYRTIAYLARVGFNDNGSFILNAGASNGSGILGPTIPTTWTVHVGNGYNVHPAFKQEAAPNAGNGAIELNRGGWVLVFVELDQAYTQKIGFLGRFDDTAYRTLDGGLRWAAAWSGVLDADDRQQTYDSVAEWAARHGVILKYTSGRLVDGVWVTGESTAESFAPTSGLSAADQAARFPTVKILPAYGAAHWRTSAELVLGVNQTANPAQVAIGHGPEIGLALAKRAAAATSEREMWIGKMAQGSTFLTPSNGLSLPNGVASAAQSWNPVEWRFADSFLFAAGVSHFYRWEQDARLQGVGIEVKLIEWLIGLNDVCLIPSLIPDDATYQGWLQDFYDQFMLYTGLSNVKVHLPRAHTRDPSYNATTGPRVRAGQAAFEAANPTLVQMMDTDTLPVIADNVHFTAAAQKTIAAAGFAWGGL